MITDKKKITIPKKYSILIVEAIFIVIAVFLSFMADDYREYRNTRAMEQEYLEGIYEDLKMDSLHIQLSIKIFEDMKEDGMKLLRMVDIKNGTIDSAALYFQSLMRGSF